MKTPLFQAKNGLVICRFGKRKLFRLLLFTRFLVSIHYANTAKYTAIFHCCKNVNFQMIFFYMFLTFAQNIDCGYTLEPP